MPVLVALEPQAGSAEYVAVAFGAFMLLQVWMLIATYAIEAAEGLYGVRVKGFWWMRASRWILETDVGEQSKRVGLFQAIWSGLLSFSLTNYAFAVAYLFLSQRDEDAFGVGNLGVVDALYYGFATSVTYGDLDPLSAVARIVVMLQLALTLVYTLFVFSVLGGVVQQALRKSPD